MPRTVQKCYTIRLRFTVSVEVRSGSELYTVPQKSDLNHTIGTKLPVKFQKVHPSKSGPDRRKSLENLQARVRQCV